MKKTFINILIFLFIILPLKPLIAKNLEIAGVNFEKNYDNFFDKLYFHLFTKEKSAGLSDIAYISSDPYVMCLHGEVDWENNKCEDYSQKINDHKKKQEQLLNNSQIKPYVISSSDKNFNQQILYIDSDSGRILRLSARSTIVVGEYITKKITDKSLRNEASHKLCREKIHSWFNEIIKEYNIKEVSSYMYSHKPWVRIGDYIVEYKCKSNNSWNVVPLLTISHDSFDLNL